MRHLLVRRIKWAGCYGIIFLIDSRLLLVLVVGLLFAVKNSSSRIRLAAIVLSHIPVVIIVVTNCSGNIIIGNNIFSMKMIILVYYDVCLYFCSFSVCIVSPN